MSLEVLRRLRGEAVEALVMELSRITQSLWGCEERYRRIEAQLQAETDRCSQFTQAGLTIEALLEWQVRLDAYQADLHQVRIDMEQATASWTGTRNLLVEANQECKLLDRVLEARDATKRADLARQEQRIMDEAASRRYLSR